jgi:hypothetical protein
MYESIPIAAKELSDKQRSILRAVEASLSIMRQLQVSQWAERRNVVTVVVRGSSAVTPGSS